LAAGGVGATSPYASKEVVGALSVASASIGTSKEVVAAEGVAETNTEANKGVLAADVDGTNTGTNKEVVIACATCTRDTADYVSGTTHIECAG
jgi:hypothetical protein